MRVLGLLAAAVASTQAILSKDFDYPEAFKQPRQDKFNLRKAGHDAEHASNKVYPPAPAPDSPKTFDVWAPLFRELYEKVRAPPPPQSPAPRGLPARARGPARIARARRSNATAS